MSGKILFVCEHYVRNDSGGARLMDLDRFALEQLGYLVHYLLLGSDKLSVFEKLLYKCLLLKSDVPLKEYLSLLFIIKNSQKEDIIFVNYSRSYLVAFIGCCFGRKVVVRSHNDEFSYFYSKLRSYSLSVINIPRIFSCLIDILSVKIAAVILRFSANGIIFLSNAERDSFSKAQNFRYVIFPFFAVPSQDFVASCNGEEPSNTRLRKVVFLGSGKFFANSLSLQDFCDEVDMEKANMELHVIGSGYSELFMSQYCMRKVVFHGFVKDLSSSLKNYDLALAPISIGAGIKVKIIDYLLAGLPVLAHKHSKIAFEDFDCVLDYGSTSDFNGKVSSFCIPSKEDVFNEVELLCNSRLKSLRQFLAVI